jgi:hypothetical protein
VLSYDILLDCPFYALMARTSPRKIWSNHLELKKMTAHDYEDLLQVSIETFNQHCLTFLGSVQYLSLMASSLSHTTCVS